MAGLLVSGVLGLDTVGGSFGGFGSSGLQSQASADDVVSAKASAAIVVVCFIWFPFGLLV